MKLEIRAFPLPLQSDVDLEVPGLMSFLGMDVRGKVAKQLHVVALVDPDGPRKIYKLRLAQEGIEMGDDKVGLTPIGHASVEKPRPANYWLFFRTE